MSEFAQSIRGPTLMKTPTSDEEVQWSTDLLNMPGICISW